VFCSREPIFASHLNLIGQLSKQLTRVELSRRIGRKRLRVGLQRNLRGLPIAGSLLQAAEERPDRLGSLSHCVCERWMLCCGTGLQACLSRFRGLFSAACLAIIALAGVSCSRPATPAPQRLAVLRFENVGADSSLDWMGRAFSEIVTAELAGVPALYAIPSSRLHSLDPVLGPRPISTPGISAERTLALASGANRIGYGQFSVRSGRIDARLAIEDPETGKTIQQLSASAGSTGVIEAASALAKRIAAGAGNYGTKNPQALRAYIAGLEGPNAAQMAGSLNDAIAADPNFAAPYLLLAQLKSETRDQPGAISLLEQALASHSITGLARARMELEAANLRGDAPGRSSALAAILRMDPSDPVVWRAAAEAAMDNHQFRAAVEDYQKALQIEPQDVGALNALGYAAAYAGELAIATQALHSYAKLRPSDANALDSEGDVNLIQGNLREAEGFYLQAEKKDPNFLAGEEIFKAAMARLMTGDIPGANALEKQYMFARWSKPVTAPPPAPDGAMPKQRVEVRVPVKDPLADYQKAEWSWVSGQRKAAYRDMEALARSVEAGASKSVAARAYAQLAFWSLALGDRAAAADMAQKSTVLADPETAGMASLARFVAQPSASATQWSERAARQFPQNAQEIAKNLTLAYALLFDKQFKAAASLLEQAYRYRSPTSDNGLPLLLAWSYLEDGRTNDAAPLLEWNPVPPRAGSNPLECLYFPRIFYLRGLAAERLKKTAEASQNYRLFLRLCGSDPLTWGEERKAREAIAPAN
jgi:tetratricopeptide (TPR) repeat protein